MSSDNEKALAKQRKKQKQQAAKNDWFETSVNGGVIILQMLKEIANKVPAPYLREAVNYTLVIIQLVQTVRENKADFRLIAIDAATLVANIYRSYERSDNKADWPGPKLSADLGELIATLLDIQVFTDARSGNKMIHRIFNKEGDKRKIQEYRTRLNHAMSSFQVVAQLEIYDLLRLVNDKVDKDYDHARVNEEKARRDREELERLLLAKHKKDQQEAEERRKKEEEIRRKEKETAQDAARLNWLKDDLRAADQRVHLLELEEQTLRLQIDKLKHDELAANRHREDEERRRKKVLEELAQKERLRKAKASQRPVVTDSSDDSSEEDESTDDDTDTEDDIIRFAAKKRARKSARKANLRPTKSAQESLNDAFAKAGLPPSPFISSPYLSPQPIYLPAFAYPAYPAGNANIHSGNFVNSTVSNVNNDHSRNDYTWKSSKKSSKRH